MEVAAVAIIALVILHTVSVEMRLADLTRRLESVERSLDRLCKVWWEGMARRNGFSVEHAPESTAIYGSELPDEFSIGTDTHRKTPRPGPTHDTWGI